MGDSDQERDKYSRGLNDDYAVGARSTMRWYQEKATGLGGRVYRLEDEVVEIRISAVMDKYSDLIKPGTLFNRRFAESLPEEIDKMGESGEFHTEIAGLK